MNEQKPEGKNVGWSALLGGHWHVLMQTVPWDDSIWIVEGITSDVDFARAYVRAALPASGLHRKFKTVKDVTPNAALSRDSAEGDGVGLKS